MATAVADFTFASPRFLWMAKFQPLVSLVFTAPRWSSIKSDLAYGCCTPEATLVVEFCVEGSRKGGGEGGRSLFHGRV